MKLFSASDDQDRTPDVAYAARVRKLTKIGKQPRRPPGGAQPQSRRAGIAAGPLTPGVTYEFWIVGHNSQGDGPESNHVTHAVPVGP